MNDAGQALALVVAFVLLVMSWACFIGWLVDTGHRKRHRKPIAKPDNLGHTRLYGERFGRR